MYVTSERLEKLVQTWQFMAAGYRDVEANAQAAGLELAIKHLDGLIASEADPEPATTDDRSLITADDVAERLGVPKSRVYEMARQERIPHVRIGRLVRFSPVELESWIREGGQDLPGGWREEPENR